MVRKKKDLFTLEKRAANRFIPELKNVSLNIRLIKKTI